MPTFPNEYPDNTGGAELLEYAAALLEESPLELKAERFSKHLAADEISGAALCKARQKVKYTAFEELFEQTAVTAPRASLTFGRCCVCHSLCGMAQCGFVFAKRTLSRRFIPYPNRVFAA